MLRIEGSSNSIDCKEGDTSMKSSFLFIVITATLMANVAFGQTKKTVKKSSTKVQKTAAPAVAPAPVKKQVTTTAAAEEVKTEVSKSSFDKFYERLSIGYFGVLTTPNFENWDSRYAALSPEFSGGTNQDSYAMNLWSQVNFAYNFGAKMKFNVIPRFTVFLDEAPTQGAGERGMILIEDALIGFSGVVYSSSDKKFNWWMRPGVRLSTSHFSRHYNHPDFGRLSHQLEWLNSFTYDFNPTWQLGLTFQDRYWIFDDRYNASRNRLLYSPFLIYTVNDSTKIQAYYEIMFENNKRWESINGQKPVYYDVWQNAYIGVAKDITSKLNVFPYISVFVNDVPLSMQSVWAGAWISYQIK